jgi:hypothetical protein
MVRGVEGVTQRAVFFPTLPQTGAIQGQPDAGQVIERLTPLGTPQHLQERGPQPPHVQPLGEIAHRIVPKALAHPKAPSRMAHQLLGRMGGGLPKDLTADEDPDQV